MIWGRCFVAKASHLLQHDWATRSPVSTVAAQIDHGLHGKDVARFHDAHGLVFPGAFVGSLWHRGGKSWSKSWLHDMEKRLLTQAIIH